MRTTALPLFVAVAAFVSTASRAAVPSDRVFPQSTVGYLSIASVPEMSQRWSSTLIGRLADDPTMRPFVDQIEGRINNRFGELEQRVGVTLEDIRAAASGEAAVAGVRAEGARKTGRAAVLIDSTGRDAEARQLLQKIDQRLVARGAAKSVDGAISVYRLPPEPKDKLPERTVALFYEAGQIGVAEGAELASAMLAAVRAGGVRGALADNPAYAETQRRAAQSAGAAPQTVRWYLSPFEWEIAMRPVPQPGDAPPKKSVMAILREQGFDAIRGLGGVVSIAPSEQRDFVHHTFVFAPPVKGRKGDPAEQKYELAMRMLEMPNDAADLTAADLPIEGWVPRQVASYKRLHLDINNAFDHLGTLFDAMYAYEGAFENTLKGFEKDPYGPKIKIRDEIVRNLGERVVVMNDYTLPIDPECERYLIALDVTDQEAIREPLIRWLEADGAQQKRLGDIDYWEIVPEDEETAKTDNFDPLLPLDEPPAREEEQTRVLRRAAVSLHKDRLLIASDAEFLRQALFEVSAGASLEQSPDLRAALDALVDIAPGKRAAWTFARNDELFRPTYELIREGKMPQSQTFFGRLLNRLLTTEDERQVGALRPQRIQGEKLPSFELARRYLAPSARSVRSEGDGWMISGVVLSKAPDADGPAASVARAGGR
ncbi:hypothetical protein [Botrimarina sp.]|uniref:hypothetical protein n=1 Tax=Botrimarina sp. TaxID=2795802 RepID=UPI0032EFEE54